MDRKDGKFEACSYNKDLDRYTTYCTGTYQDVMMVGEVLANAVRDERLVDWTRNEKGYPKAEPVDWIEIWDEKENKRVGYFDKDANFVESERLVGPVPKCSGLQPKPQGKKPQDNEIHM